MHRELGLLKQCLVGGGRAAGLSVEDGSRGGEDDGADGGCSGIFSGDDVHTAAVEEGAVGGDLGGKRSNVHHGRRWDRGQGVGA